MNNHKTIDRAEFLRVIAAATAAAALPTAATAAESPRTQSAAAKPKVLWKGFNLLNKFNPDFQTTFSEEDFEIMAEWGFNFARIPLSYWCWTSPMTGTPSTRNASPRSTVSSSWDGSTAYT